MVCGAAPVAAQPVVPSNGLVVLLAACLYFTVPVIT